jgi:DNA uptake protein ComE-like DNA-binding protein
MEEIMNKRTSRGAAPLWAGLALILSAAACSRASSTAAAQATAPAASAADAQSAALAAKLNLNTASGADFLTVPGVGDRMVREFMEYRPYTSIEQFRREIGKYVDDAQVAAYEQYVFVPIAPNQADAATLMQIPGLDETEAQALIDGRPYASSGDFLARLAGYVAESDLSAATSYLSAS